MENLRRAIARMGKQVRALEGLKERQFGEGLKNKETPRKLGHKTDKQTIDKQLQPRRSVAKSTYPPGFEGLVGHLEKKRYKEFLNPLGMSNLKILKDRIEPYNKEKAVNEWSKRKSKDALIIYQRFVDNQNQFNKILELLVELTPETLFPKTEYNHNKIMQEYERERSGSKYDTPKYSFDPVPKFNKNMSVSEFDKYIDLLTSTRFFHENASSINGVVNDILLYTHQVDNLEFKTKRTVHTYNKLIKWYGYDKNQGLFARSLLVSMKKDGIDPDIETINTLLKTMNFGVRGYSNRLVLITNYLQLCQQYGLKVNLLTWNRIYRLLDNIYLKELYLNKITSLNLPITRDLVYSIVDDYMKLGNDNVIEFIEQDLGLKDWQTDSKVVNKVNYFQKRKGRPPVEVNDYSLPYMMQGIKDDRRLSASEKVCQMMKLLEGQYPILDIGSQEEKQAAAKSQSKHKEVASSDKVKLVTHKEKPVVDVHCYRMIISQLNQVNYDIYTIHKVLNHLVLKFDEVSHSGKQQHNIKLLKYYVRDFYEVESKLDYFGLKVSSQLTDLDALKFDRRLTFQVPEKLQKKNQLGKIHKMTSKKFIIYTSSIEDRLKNTGYIQDA